MEVCSQRTEDAAMISFIVDGNVRWLRTDHIAERHDDVVNLRVRSHQAAVPEELLKLAGEVGGLSGCDLHAGLATRSIVTSW